MSRIMIVVLVIWPGLGCRDSQTDPIDFQTDPIADKSVHPPGWYVPRDAPLASYLEKNGDFLAALRSAAYKKGCHCTTDSNGKLVALALKDTRVSADEFGRICEFRELRSLYIGWGAIDDSALAHVTSLSNLEELGLPFNLITDQGVRHISTLKRLKKVRLGEMPLTDDAVKELCELPTIRCLDLSGTRITDASIRHLRKLDGLEELCIYDTQITRAGVESLRKALPGCRVRDKL